MTREEFYTFVEGKFETLMGTLKNKQGEYAKTTNAFHNFDEGYMLATSDSPEEYAWDLRSKHMQSIKDIITSDNVYPKELTDEKFGDDILYGFIIWAMYQKNYK